MSKRRDLTGQRFGRLIVIEFSHSDKHGHACWLCKCDCGNEKIVVGNYLKMGNTKSCGCLLKEYQEKQKLPKGVAARNQIIDHHKRMAKTKNLEQALTNEQIIVLHKENCHYCGAPPSNICSRKDGNGSYTYNGIDRVDNDIGYTLVNVVSCCDFCNKAKKAMPVEEFQEQYKRIQLYLNSIVNHD